MRHLVIALSAMLVLGTAAGVVANTPVDLQGTGLVMGSGGGATIPAGRPDFIEGWNVDGNPVTWTYGGSIFAMMYYPGQTYYLQRVEFVAGGLAGTALIQIVGDDGSGLPDGPVLAEGYFDQVVDRTWQGADMDQCVLLEQGALYWVKYWVVVGSYCSIAESGVGITYYWGYDNVNWNGPITGYPWMAKFYGGFDPTANEASTWGGVKALLK